ncbi:MAG: hypothetical protein N3A69_13245 [Leptospiraceae bacterium]|nr:hypothetical protein [Leptospiraceae bacterium]
MHLVYFGFLFLYTVSLFSIQERDLFFFHEVNFLIGKISFFAFAWIFPITLFIIHAVYLVQKRDPEIFFSNFNFLKWKIYPHHNKLFQNVQFIFYNIVVVTTLFLNLFLLYVFPILLFSFTLIKFSKVQDLLLDWYQFSLLCLDAWFVVFYFFYTRKEFESYFQLSKNNLLNKLSLFFLEYVPYSLLGAFFIFGVINFSLSNSILLTEAKEIQNYTLNSLTLPLNPLFYETSEEYSFLFPRLNLAYQDLTNETNIYFYKRNFLYANFTGAKLKFLSFHSANTNFANFQEAIWE